MVQARPVEACISKSALLSAPPLTLATSVPHILLSLVRRAMASACCDFWRRAVASAPFSVLASCYGHSLLVCVLLPLPSRSRGAAAHHRNDSSFFLLADFSFSHVDIPTSFIIVGARGVSRK